MNRPPSNDRSDPSDGPPAAGSYLSLARAEALARCCDALADPPARRTTLPAALHDLCAAARRDGVLAEQFLIEFKQALAESARRRGLSSVEANAERVRLVTLAIDTYYSRQA